ncbi:MAG: flagellar biosynthesis protein FlhF [Gammaproteobacteria bacterium]|uniref:flagellar biosynthesis protein FlhF n=1 Tax=unclassified Marinomonas TaxID=196814 RepID=UPI000C1DD517|nr:MULTISPECIES: flagellar biosynthesis protein FlhF [unclassified Marinomonas]MBU1295856.1 flagellar biosynthesis protein FlhF [Gammaproteobacteria bacterium]MBU1466248.1 flagellar biosynthesis protein FlhF [Gammaproteobacteria bacterium]MBU2020788.1 flagellar biosynthesis protein FlhF [Gammaproteobacteria bacterium]MBU2237805.1 flagellar biosynthesis protein FlhF [Gammaproteobacteria bacterium]MBU2316986.1 flagellar biosynthesis protein FlhF [Gammaproteobacteria bacterium]
MQIRRFRAPDMRQAIRKVRDAVGPDAVILSNQRLPTGEIEIVAALDYDGSLPSSMTSKRSSAPRSEQYVDPSADYLERIERAKQQTPPQVSSPSYSEKRPTAQFEMPPLSSDREDPAVEEALSIRNSDSAKQLRDMELELKNVRAMLEQRQQNESRSEAKENAVELRAREKLKGLGLSDFVVSRLIDDIDLKGREDDWNRLLAHLADYIPIRSSSSELRGCIAFMGPTGVGKTTTIGKIAAQHVLKHGSEGVVLITTDTYRIAAHEQLRTFGRILNVPVEVVNEYSDLNEVLAKYANYSLVLVDTAGMNPRDSNLERQLLMMKRARASLKKLLVLPCTSQRQVLKTVVDVYSQVQLDGCVLSKLDESASLGEAISVVIEEGLPVVYIADGQRIPDDIEPARAHNLISRAVYTAEHYSQLYGSLKYGS